MMTELPKYYTTLVNAVEDALESMEAASYGLARDRLIAGLQAAEEAYLELGEDERAADGSIPLTGRQPKSE